MSSRKEAILAASGGVETLPEVDSEPTVADFEGRQNFEQEASFQCKFADRFRASYSAHGFGIVSLAQLQGLMHPSILRAKPFQL